jgi:hypothetical protein
MQQLHSKQQAAASSKQQAAASSKQQAASSKQAAALLLSDLDNGRDSDGGVAGQQSAVSRGQYQQRDSGFTGTLPHLLCLLLFDNHARAAVDLGLM